MRTTLSLAFAFVSITCLGCATPYQPVGFTGGFSETQLAPDLFRITFEGNGYTSTERAQDFALLRAADLCTEHGFKYFAIANESNTTDVSSFTTPGSAQTTGTTYLYGSGSGNYYGNYYGQTTYTPPQTHFIFKPKTGLLVQFLKEKPEKGYLFDAAFLQQSIRGKYKIE
jgi:hypothetical protein